jgi:hypothetical protein
MAGDEENNVGIMVRSILTSPEKSLGTWIACEAERISCRQLVAALDSAARSQGVDKSVTFEECTMQSMEEKWGVVGNEIGQMMTYIAEVKDRAFENTSGLPEITADQLGIELVDTKSFYENLDCVALLKQVDNDEVHLGTVSR